MNSSIFKAVQDIKTTIKIYQKLREREREREREERERER